MPLPLLAPLIGLGGKLIGGLFSGKGKARRAARRASGKRGIGRKILGGIGKLFKRRSKSQRIQKSADRLFARDTRKAARRDKRNDRRFERQLKKLGGSLPDTAELPPELDVQSNGGFRAIQQFQAPQEASLFAKLTGSTDEPEATPKGMDQKTMLMIGGGVAALLLFMNMKK